MRESAQAAHSTVPRRNEQRPQPGSVGDLQSTPNVMLVGLPTILASGTISLTATVYAMMLVAVASLWMKRSSTSWFDIGLPCLLLPIASLSIVLRPNYPNTAIHVVLFILACVVIGRVVYLSASTSDALISLIDGIGVFLATSLLLWLAGFGGPHDRTSGLDNSLTGGERIVFPLSNSLAATPAMAAVYVAAVIPILLSYRQYRNIRLVGVICAIAIFVLTDSRISLIGALLASAAVLLIPRIFRGAAPWISGALLLIPFIYGVIQSGLGRIVSAASTYSPWLARLGEDAYTLNRRDYIWSQSLAFYWERVGWISQTVGHGSYGQTESGASSYYSANLTGLGRDDRLLTPHNSLLQILFDGGWVTLGAIGATIVLMAVTLSRRNSPVDLSALAMLVTLLIVGSTEVALSPGHAQPTWWILVALGFIVFARKRTQSAPVCAATPRS
uniref:O-antigen ligase-related domain-containing protein n=1 Tax=Mycolicibacterium gilvum (strain PYR-GCK) TaxID=350054 RepID=A4TF54_MYCGI|nr:hypothetical protein Mflv_4760 [Mycolicibacterium gilvum PYR-GCK]